VTPCSTVSALAIDLPPSLVDPDKRDLERKENRLDLDVSFIIPCEHSVLTEIFLCCIIGLVKRPTTWGGRVARDPDFGLEGPVWQPVHFFLALVASLLHPSVEIVEEAAPDETV